MAFETFGYSSTEKHLMRMQTDINQCKFKAHKFLLHSNSDIIFSSNAFPILNTHSHKKKMAKKLNFYIANNCNIIDAASK